MGGLPKGVDMSRIWIDWQELNRKKQNKKIIYFGEGEWIDKTISKLDLDGDFIVDNNKFVQGRTYLGLTIHSPEKLKTINKDKYMILIMTTGYWAVCDQLESYGFEAGKHFAVSPSLKNYKVIEDIQSVSTQLLISCYDTEDKDFGGGLYHYDINEMSYQKVFSGRCHGISCYGEHFYVIDDSVTGVRIFDNKLVEEKILTLPKGIGPHGIAYHPDEQCIAVAQSSTDSVCFYDTNDSSLLNQINISDKYQHTNVAQHHINDIMILGNSLYVSMFSITGNWKRGVFDGGILEYNIKTGKCYGTVVSNLWCPHSILLANNAISYLDSMRGDLYDTTWIKITSIPGWARGLAFDGHYYFIGQSLHRHLDRLTGASNNIPINAGIYIVDPVTKATRFLHLPEITNIHALSVYDSAL